MDHIPPEMMRFGWMPEDDGVRARPAKDKFEPYIGRNPYMTSSADDQAVIRWVKDVMKNSTDKEVADVVDDRLSWIFYDDTGGVIARLPMAMIDRIRAVVRVQQPVVTAEKEDIKFLVGHAPDDEGFKHDVDEVS